MFTPYRFRKDPVQRVQSFVNHLFLEVMCRAPKRREARFTPSMLPPRYAALLHDVQAAYLLKPLQRIYTVCRTLPPPALKTLRRAVHTNNRIRELCQGMGNPVSYAELKAIDAVLAHNIRLFCDHLYEDVLERAPFERTFGSVKAYYRRLVDRDNTCRFCRLEHVHNRFSTRYSAFDHYLPKSVYPFVSVNFHNLVPTCDMCNEDYKNRHDPIFLKRKQGQKVVATERVKAFYPFRYEKPDIRISFSLERPYGLETRPEEIRMRVTCPDHQEETDTWVRIYGLQERYKGYCCSDEMLGYIENQFIARRLERLTPEEYRKALSTDPHNFLRAPFLEAVEEIYRHEK